MRRRARVAYRGGVRAEKPSLPLVVFSDVDGVLTVPQASASIAATALAPLVRAHVPIVLCSSKTRSELEVIQRELGIRDPFVCEGGGAVFIPGDYFEFDVPEGLDIAGYRAIEFGMPYREVVKQLRRAAERLRIDLVGFDDLTVEEVARDCNIPLLSARLAKLREYEEPFRIVDPDPSVRRRLIKGLHAVNLRCVNRGRYDHAGAMMVDATLGVSVLCRLYRRAYGPIVTIGLADAFADDTLLRLVDHPIIVQDDPDVRGAVDLVGWAEAIAEIAQDLGAVSRV
jgi:mannosyl-3-phosphoglycerate phosphatase